MEIRTCSTCLISKPTTDFYPRYSFCKPCYTKRYPKKQKERTPETRVYHAQKTRESRARARETNPVEYAHTKSMHNIKHSYGLTEEQLQDMLTAQRGLCAICQTDLGLADTSRKRAYVVDHNHKTGKVRGLLCTHCNTVLGHLEKLNLNPVVYTEYLQKHD